MRHATRTWPERSERVSCGTRGSGATGGETRGSGRRECFMPPRDGPAADGSRVATFFVRGGRGRRAQGDGGGTPGAGLEWCRMTRRRLAALLGVLGVAVAALVALRAREARAPGAPLGEDR